MEPTVGAPTNRRVELHGVDRWGERGRTRGPKDSTLMSRVSIRRRTRTRPKDLIFGPYDAKQTPCHTAIASTLKASTTKHREGGRNKRPKNGVNVP